MQSLDVIGAVFTAQRSDSPINAVKAKMMLILLIMILYPCLCRAQLLIMIYYMIFRYYLIMQKVTGVVTEYLLLLHVAQ
jgi:hypothetical protein